MPLISLGNLHFFYLLYKGLVDRFKFESASRLEGECCNWYILIFMVSKRNLRTSLLGIWHRWIYTNNTADFNDHFYYYYYYGQDYIRNQFGSIRTNFNFSRVKSDHCIYRLQSISIFIDQKKSVVKIIHTDQYRSKLIKSTQNNLLKNLSLSLIKIQKN